MAAVWGYAEIETHIDGSALPREVAEEAREAAAVGGKEFTTRFKKEMRGAATQGAREFGRNLTRAIREVVTSNGLVRSLTRGFRLLGLEMRQTGRFIATGVTRPFRLLGRELADFGRIVRDDSIKTVGELREGARHLKIDFDDLRQTFPLVERAVRGVGSAFRSVGQGFRYVRDEAKGFGTIVREDSIKTMNMLRDGAKDLNVSLKDVQDTFPGLTRAARGVGNGFRYVRDRVVELGPDMDKVRPLVENTGNSFRRFFNRLSLGRQTLNEFKIGTNDVRTALANLAVDIDKDTRAIEDMADAQRMLSEHTERMKNVTEDESDAVRESTKESNNSTRSKNRLSKALSGVSGSVKKMLSDWKRLPHGFRQAAFWTGLVISALGTLSVLGSAVGGSIAILATALVGVAAAAGVAVIGFTGLFEEGRTLGAGAQATRDAFSRLGDTFNRLQTTVVESMFNNMAGSVDALGSAVDRLHGPFGRLAEDVGNSISRVFTAISSDEGVAKITELLDGFGPIFDNIITAIIGFGDAFASIMIVALPYVQEFTGWLGQVATDFASWANSEDGRTRIAEWLDTARTIMPEVGELFVALGDALAGLVTPETIEGTKTFLDSLINFMPILGEFVGIIANLNIFGILAAALEAVGQFAAPLIPIFQQFALTFSEQIIPLLQDEVGPALGALGEAITPVIEFLGVLINAVLPPLIELFSNVVEGIAEIIEEFVGAEKEGVVWSDALNVMGNVVRTVFEAIGNIISAGIDFFVGFVKIISDLLSGDFEGAFDQAFETVDNILDNFGFSLDDVIKWFNDFLGGVEDVWNDIEDAIGDAIDNIVGFLGDLWAPIQNAINWFGSLFGAASEAESQGNSASTPRRASGGILWGPQRIIAGEEGPEAIVPLSRSLSRVDPSVRALSAIAQGMATPAMASGGIATPTDHSVNIEAGAFVINDATNALETSVYIVNRIAERVSG